MEEKTQTDKTEQQFGHNVGDLIRWTEEDSRGLKSYQVSVIVRVDRPRWARAHAYYTVAGRKYPVRDDLVRNNH